MKLNLSKINKLCDGDVHNVSISYHDNKYTSLVIDGEKYNPELLTDEEVFSFPPGELHSELAFYGKVKQITVRDYLSDEDMIELTEGKKHSRLYMLLRDLKAFLLNLWYKYIVRPHKR